MRINFILVICGFIFFSGCALNQDVKNLERRMLQLEIKMQQIKDDIASQQAKDNRLKDQYAGQGAEFYQLKEEVAKLNGRIDETEHNFDQALKKNAAAIAQSIQTTSGSESGLRGQESVMGPEPMVPNQMDPQAVPAESPGGSAAPGNFSEKETYNIAKQAYDRGDYEVARQGFETFLKNYPKSDEADNARFWIGESYFKEGWFQKAILEYQEVIEKYPNDNKAPSAYLKQGLAFDKLGEKANARLVFQELIKKFPNSGEAKTARQKISQLE
ncbi:MAG: tol-pal system protein YbgF [Desulfosalsimonadaceae bacterium]